MTSGRKMGWSLVGSTAVEDHELSVLCTSYSLLSKVRVGLPAYLARTICEFDKRPLPRTATFGFEMQFLGYDEIGFCSDFPRPDFESARNGRKPPWPPEFGVEVVTLQPGEALVFTESLMHSTALYKGRGQRRTLFCKLVLLDNELLDPQRIDAMLAQGIHPN